MCHVGLWILSVSCGTMDTKRTMVPVPLPSAVACGIPTSGSQWNEVGLPLGPVSPTPSLGFHGPFCPFPSVSSLSSVRSLSSVSPTPSLGFHGPFCPFPSVSSLSSVSSCLLPLGPVSPTPSLVFHGPFCSFPSVSSLSSASAVPCLLSRKLTGVCEMMSVCSQGVQLSVR